MSANVIEPWMRDAAAQLTRCVWSDTFADPEAGVAEVIAAAYAQHAADGELRAVVALPEHGLDEYQKSFGDRPMLDMARWHNVWEAYMSGFEHGRRVTINMATLREQETKLKAALAAGGDG